MTEWTVRTACEVAGQWRVPGVPFALTQAQAKHLAPPFGNVIAPHNATEPKNGRQHRRKRAHRKAAQ